MERTASEPIRSWGQRCSGCFVHSGRGVGLTAIQEVTKELDGHVELRLGQQGLVPT